MSYDNWKTTPPKGNGFNCPDCLCDCTEAEEVGTDEQGIRHFKCPHCDTVFAEDAALSDSEAQEEADISRAEARRDEMDGEVPF